MGDLSCKYFSLDRWLHHLFSDVTHYFFTINLTDLLSPSWTLKYRSFILNSHQNCLFLPKFLNGPLFVFLVGEVGGDHDLRLVRYLSVPRHWLLYGDSDPDVSFKEERRHSSGVAGLCGGKSGQFCHGSCRW